MTSSRNWFSALLMSSALAGCLQGGSDEGLTEEMGVSSEALDACNTAPAATLDGFPAFAQCSATLIGSIYSNDGINTSTTSMGADWIETQGSGGYQCTELVTRYFHFKWKVPVAPWGGIINGNAGVWCDGALPAGVEKTMTAVHGDAIVLRGGSCGASFDTGHIALVDKVTAAAVTTVEQNEARAGLYMTSCAACFLHVTANNGTDTGTGTGGMGTGGMGTGGMAIGGTGAAGIGGAGGSPVPPPSPPGTGGMQVTTPVPTQPPVGTAGMGVAGMSAPTPIVPVTVPATVPSIAQMQGSHDSSASCSVKAGGGNPVGMWLLLGLTGMLVQRRRRVV